MEEGTFAKHQLEVSYISMDMRTRIMHILKGLPLCCHEKQNSDDSMVTSPPSHVSQVKNGRKITIIQCYAPNKCNRRTGEGQILVYIKDKDRPYTLHSHHNCEGDMNPKVREDNTNKETHHGKARHRKYKISFTAFCTFNELVIEL